MIGAGDGKLGKPTGATVSRRYSISWQRQELDLTELAKSRWVERLNIDALAKKFGVGRTFLVAELGRIQSDPNLVLNGAARRLVKLKKKRFFGDDH